MKFKEKHKMKKQAMNAAGWGIQVKGIHNIHSQIQVKIQHPPN